MIKKSLTLFASILLIFAGCSSTTGKQSVENEKITVENEAGKPIHLTYDMFLEKVWNFEQNPQNWKFEGEIPAVIDFYADWCQPCKRIAPIMEKLAKDYEGRLNVYKIDVDDEQKLAAVFRVQSIPAVLFTPVDGQPMMQAGALTEEMYVKIIEEQLLKK